MGHLQRKFRKRYKEGQYKIKEGTYQEKTIVNACASNNRASNYIGKSLIKLKAEIVDKLDQLEHYLQQQWSMHSFSSTHGIHQNGLISALIP